MIGELSMKKKVIVEKPSGAIAVADPTSAIQRKFYDGFLYVIKETLRKEPEKTEFEISLSELKKFYGIEDKKNTYLKERIRELMRSIVEFNILNKDYERWGVFPLLSYVDIYIDKKTKAGIIKFEIPSIVKKAIINKEKNFFFAKIDLVVIRGLKSKYSIILYELLKDYENAEIPEMDFDKFRKIFGIMNKYKNFQDLKKRVLDTAIKELNGNPNIDWDIDYKLQKIGPKYTHIKFTKKPKPTKLKLQQQANKIIEGEVKENPDLQELILLLPDDLKNRAKIINIVLGGIENKGKEYTKAQIEYVVERFNKGKIKNVEIYLKKAIEEDYAGAEKINLGDVVNDWKQKLIDMKKVYILDDGDYVMKFIKDCDDEDGMCDVQFVSIKDSEKIKWARVPEEKLKNILKKRR